MWIVGVDVRLTGFLGLGVRVEAVDCPLPSRTRAIDGALPGQVSPAGQSQGRPPALGPAVTGLASGFGGVEAARWDLGRILCGLRLGGRGGPSMVCRLLLLAAPAVGSPRSRSILNLVEGGALPSTLRSKSLPPVLMRTAVWVVVWRHLAILAPLGVLVGPSFSLRYFRIGLSFSSRELPASLPGPLAILSVATQELVGRARGRPLGIRPVATGLAPGVGNVVDAGQVLEFLVLGEREAPGLIRGGPWRCRWRRGSSR